MCDPELEIFSIWLSAKNLTFESCYFFCTFIDLSTFTRFKSRFVGNKKSCLNHQIIFLDFDFLPRIIFILSLQ